MISGSCKNKMWNYLVTFGAIQLLESFCWSKLRRNPDDFDFEHIFFFDCKAVQISF